MIFQSLRYCGPGAISPTYPSSVWPRAHIYSFKLILGLMAVIVGGDMVTKLSHPETVITSKIIYMLGPLARTLCAWKPLTMYTKRGIFHLMARGIGEGKDNSQLVAVLRVRRVYA